MTLVPPPLSLNLANQQRPLREADMMVGLSHDYTDKTNEKKGINAYWTRIKKIVWSKLFGKHNMY